MLITTTRGPGDGFTVRYYPVLPSESDDAAWLRVRTDLLGLGHSTAGTTWKCAEAPFETMDEILADTERVLAAMGLSSERGDPAAPRK